jgi:hypothetical protein
MTKIFPSSVLWNLSLNSGIGVNLDFMISLIFSASPSGSLSPTTCPSLKIPKIKAPPNVFANALTLLHQLFGFFSSSASFLSY